MIQRYRDCRTVLPQQRRRPHTQRRRVQSNAREHKALDPISVQYPQLLFRGCRPLRCCDMTSPCRQGMANLESVQQAHPVAGLVDDRVAQVIPGIRAAWERPGVDDAAVLAARIVPGQR